MKLKLAKELTLPLTAATEVLGFIGRRGQGKSYAAQKYAELLHAAGVPFVVLDPVGNWYGLRLDKDGKSPGIAVPVFGGLHGDIPLEATAGKMIADVIVDRGISAVLDVSQFESDAERHRFAADFGARFYYRRKTAPAVVTLILEECQEVVPQNPMGDEKRVLHIYTRIAKLGRNYGIGLALVSQRPQEVSKKVLNLTELLFAFQLTGPHERKAVEGWIQEKGVDDDIAAILPKLERGAPHAWSPAWLKISEVVHIEPKQTFDAGSTPTLHGKAEARELAPIDLEKLRKDMAATIEKAKADDPRELRKQIAEKDRLLKQLQAGHPKGARNIPENIPSKTVEKFVLKDGQLARAEKIIERLEALRDRTGDFEEDLHTIAKEIRDAIASTRAPVVQTRASYAPEKTTQAPRVIGATVSRPAPRVFSSNGDHSITPAKQKILNALAFLHGIGVAPADKTQLALIAGVSPTSGGYFNNLGSLRSSGLIDYPSGGTVALTDAGAAIASTDGVPSTTDELHDAIRAKLPPAKWRIIEALIRSYPKAMSKDAVAEQIDVSPTSGGYFNNLGSLRSLGLLDYPQPGMVAAQPVLFLEDR